MRIAFLTLGFALSLFLGAARTEAASCSSFGTITKYNAAEKKVEVKFSNGNERKYFPKHEGTTTSSKLPNKCTN